MALSALIQFEVRQTGSDTNGGGFKAGASGIDRTLQDAAQYSVTDGVTAGTTTITSATAAFGTDVVGNVIYVQGGTGSVVAGWYEITARNSSTSVTVDRNTGLTAGTGVTLKIGGALATPGQGAALLSVSGHKCWVRYNATPYSITTTTAGASGPVKFGTTSINASVEGYEATRGDRTVNRPVIQWNTAPGSLAYGCVHNAGGTSNQEFINLTVDGNSRTNAGGFDVGNLRCSAVDCVAKNCNQTGAIGFNLATTRAIRCQANNCTTGFSGATSSLVACEALSCGTTGYAATGTYAKCMARSCGNGWTGIASSLLCQCIADSNTNAGFNITSDSIVVNCLSTNQSGGSGTGFTVNPQTKLINCAAYNNTTPISGTPFANIGQITVTADPYVNQAGADFRPNSAAGGGALLRAAGIGVFGQTDNADVGAVQHGDPGFVIGSFGGMSTLLTL